MRQNRFGDIDRTELRPLTRGRRLTGIGSKVHREVRSVQFGVRNRGGAEREPRLSREIGVLWWPENSQFAQTPRNLRWSVQTKRAKLIS
ncbi:hypothetical protein L596_007970 [Steinernema carpocapsae]|uniref:Uncharacterized protein n=1 Tax=Steinernema carpocapsae TaxID=34508 RepID=A0A4U5PB16_STECR|nr:hypothetical protein L596_007970 [Steinernema carpocapsae]